MTNTIFSNHSLNRQEKLYGTAWLLFEILLLSSLLQLLNLLLPTPLPQPEINFIFFCLNFAAVAFLLRRYLLQQLRLFPHVYRRVFMTAIAGFFAYWALNFLVSGLIISLNPNFSSVNDNAVSQLVAENFGLMLFGTVILVPFAEESLFRGLVFRGMYDKSPVLAWCLSVGLFALVHVLGYIGAYPLDRLLLCFIQYIPAGICLAATYRLSGSLLTPILIHAAVNFVGMIALR